MIIYLEPEVFNLKGETVLSIFYVKDFQCKNIYDFELSFTTVPSSLRKFKRTEINEADNFRAKMLLICIYKLFFAERFLFQVHSI